MSGKYAGTWTALITPFKSDGSLDENAFRALCKRQAEAGVNMVPVGTTGESPTLSKNECRRLFEIALEEAAGKVLVMGGTGSNSTEHAIENTKAAKEAGVDLCLVVSPYYNKPTQKGLLLHFQAVADVGLPVMVYNIKGRTGVNIETDTLMKMAEHEMIVGVKEASGDLNQMKEVIARRPDDFTVLSGDDGLTYDLIQAGGDGVISVASNLVPDQVYKMVDLARKGNFEEAGRINENLARMFKELFVETNPLPVKYAAHKMGLCELKYRLPMCEPDDEAKQVLDEMLKYYNLLT